MMLASSTSTPSASLQRPASARIGDRAENPALSRSIPDGGILDHQWFRGHGRGNPKNPNLDLERDQIRASAGVFLHTRVSSRSDHYVSLRPENGIPGIRGSNCAPRLSFPAPEGQGLVGPESRRSGRQEGRRP